MSGGTGRHMHLDDAGVSLIEVIVVVAIVGAIFLSLGGIFANILSTQANVTRQSDATVRGQQFASDIEEAMRNAVEFDHDGGTLVVQVSGGGCRTFSADTAGVRIQGLTFTDVGIGGIHYEFRAIGGPDSDTSTPGAAPPLFEGDAFARNAQTGADPAC